jgi:hypothetical protein
VTVLRRAYVEVEPDVTGFDAKLQQKFARTDPGGKAGKQLGGQLNRALSRLDLTPIDVKADPKRALAAIGATEAKLLALSRNASTVEIKVRAEQGLKEIGRFRKTLGEVVEDGGDEAASGFFARFSTRLGPLVAGLPISGPMGAAMAAAGASAAPLLGAAVAGGIIGGVGIGGVVGGLSLAAKDTRVKAASDAVGDRLEARLNRAAGAFVKPAIEGLNQVQRTIDAIDLEAIFANTADLVQPLAAGVSSAVTSIGDALEKLTANAGGPVREIADGISLIGSAAAEGLSSLADNADEGANALKTLFEITGSAVTVTFQLVNALTELYGISKQIGGDFVLQTLLKVTGAEMERVNDSARKTGQGTFGMGQEMVKAAASAEVLKEKQKGLKAVQDAAAVASNALTATLDRMGGQNTVAARTSTALATAMDNLYGATIRQADANVAYEASWDSLSGAVKGNKKSLDIHTEAGRTNREALVSLIGSTNAAYLADINAGVAIDQARKKHENRIKAIERESVKLGLNRDKTQDLISTYGKIPPRRETDLILDGVREVVRALQNIYIYQRAMAEGRSLESMEQKLRTGSDSGPAKRGGGFHEGGWTGPGSKMQPAGVVHADEFVIRKESRRRLENQAPGLLEEMNATGQLPGHARGGLVAPVDSSRRWPFRADMSGTYIMSKAQAASKVAPAFGNWPSSPAAQRGDSGVWRKVLALIRSGPKMGSFGNAYRPGDPKWHGSGRAVDWMGFNMDGLASYLAAKKPLELIHRTRQRDYAYTRGRNKGSFSEGLMNAHRNHIHIAMDDGGFRMLQPGMNLIPNGTGKPELIGGPAALSQVAGGGVTIVINNSVIASKRQAEDLLVEAYKSAKAGRRI